MRRVLGVALALGAAAPTAARADETSRGAAPVPETVVSARREPASAPREDRSAAASVITPDDSPRAYDDLGSLLLEVPGVTVARTGSISAFASLRLRGSDADQVAFFIDGVPLNIAAGGAIDVSSLPLGDVERIEVYRGSSPLAFGESALGGIVAITTRTPGATHASARAATGSFGTDAGDISVGGRAGRVRLYFGMHGLTSVGDYPYHDDNGTPLNPADDSEPRRQNDDVREANGVLRAALTLGGRRVLSLGVLGFGRDQGLPGLDFVPTTYARFHTLRALGYARYESRDDLGPGGRLAAELFASAQRDLFIDRYAEIGGVPAQLRSLTVSEGLVVNASRPFGDYVRAAVVLQGRRESLDAFDELAGHAAGVPARRASGVVGGEVDLRAPRLDLDVIPSARLEALDDQVSGRDPAGGTTPISARLPILRLGLVRPLGAGAAIKANVGRYARAPSFIEFYGNGTGRLLGNPALDPERGTNADVGLWIDHTGERLAVADRTTAFGALVEDLIRWTVNPWGQARAENTASARVYGLEEELRLAYGRRLALVAQATALVATDESASPATHGCPIAFLPRYHGYARPEIRHIALPGHLELGAYVDGDVNAANYRTGACAGTFPVQPLLGAGVAVEAPWAGLRLTASGANLTDVHPYDVPNQPLAGRLLMVALAYTPLGTKDDSAAGSFGSPGAW
jgi:iron complex outermembrane receptor protein